MHVPFYCRPPDYRYFLRSEGGYGWWTGVVHGDRQILLGLTAVVFFNREGDLLQVEEREKFAVPDAWRRGPATPTGDVPWLVEYGFEECPIRIKRFWLQERWMGIEDLPNVLAEYYTAPERFRARPEDVRGWIDEGLYVFHGGGGDYYMSRKGDVESS